MKQRFYIGFFLFIFLAASLTFSQSREAIFKGQVTDSSGSPLQGANVLLKEVYLGAATDPNGFFVIKVTPGNYTVLISFIGYEKVETRITLQRGQTLEQIYPLKVESFEIGGIVVLAEKELLPSEPETKTTIRSGEIEHIQASSLSDVLKLVPGQRFENPGLQDVKQVSLRTSSTDSEADRNAFFGTQVVIDNVPISNNANMQLETGANSGTIQRTTENSGIDLRQIPADNIEEVEVIRGIPSARYGDLSSGIVRVKTKSKSIDQRFKYKYNLQNQELNFSGGFHLVSQLLNYNLNYAHSVRDVRIKDFGYSRLAGQLSHSTNLFKNLYLMQNKLYYTRTFDEQGLREGDLLLAERYNRDYVVRYLHNSQFILTPTQRIEFALSYQVNHQNSFSKRLISVDNTYITDRMIPGTQEGRFVQHYISEMWVKGRANNLFANLEYNYMFNLLRLGHQLLTGLSYRHEFNNGPGRIFDPGYPPSITSNLRDRPRTYDNIQGLKISSFYLEDKISGKLLTPFQLNLGLRLESYGSGENLFPDNHGSFLNPRLNLALFPTSTTQIRFGYGSTSKAPSLSMLFPNDIYFDLDDINRLSATDSLVVVSTYIFSEENPNLKGFQQIKRELSLDQRVGPLGFSATVYSSTVFGGIASTRTVPIFLYKYDYPDWPDTTGRSIRDSVYTTYSVYANSQVISARGMEFSVQTKSLTSLQLRLRLEAAYNFTESQKKDYDFGSAYRFDTYLGQYVKPFWNEVRLKSENLLINYKLEFTIRKLGAWVTLEAQQVVFDKDRYYGLSDSLAVGFLTSGGQQVFIEDAERAASRYAGYRRIYPDYWYRSENQSNIWLFNLRVSKALFRGSEFSFFVNNIFNSHPLYQRRRVSVGTTSYMRLNPDLFFGVEFSGVINKFLN